MLPRIVRQNCCIYQCVKYRTSSVVRVSPALVSMYEMESYRHRVFKLFIVMSLCKNLLQCGTVPLCVAFGRETSSRTCINSAVLFCWSFTFNYYLQNTSPLQLDPIIPIPELRLHNK